LDKGSEKRLSFVECILQRMIMKRCLAILALTGLVPTVPLKAEEPHLQFIRALRADGKADLALQYLLSKSQNPSAELAAVLPLELAKTRLELAAVQPDAASRAAFREQARTDLEAFLKKNPKHALAAEAGLELARIAGLRGKALLSQARSQETKEAQRTETLRARASFEEAAKQLQTARNRMSEQLKADTATTPVDSQSAKEALLQAEARAELEEGINLLDQSQTYTEPAEFAARAAFLKKARDEILDRLAKREPQTAISWQALAWVGRCYLEDDDPQKARRVFMDVINADAGNQAEGGRRLARYFRMQTLAKMPDQKKALAEIVSAGEEWLRLYPQYAQTPEGNGVRFELAEAYLRQAQALSKSAGPAREKYENARKQFQILEESDNDYTTIARENRLNIVLLTSLDRTKGDIQKLRDFEECYLRAELERARIARSQKDSSVTKRDKERQLHLTSMVDALNRGLDLADVKSRAEDVQQARILLAYAYLTLGDYYRAAVVGEELARTEPKSVRVAMAGAYALSAYAQLLAQQQKAGTPREDLEVAQGRQRRLAEYVEQTWPTSQAADIARHVLAVMLLTDKEYGQAVEVLDRISSHYSDATRSLSELARAALQAHKNGLQPPAGKPSYLERALAALARVPDLKSSADRATARDYFAAELTLADIYYQRKQHDQLDALAQKLAEKLAGTEEGIQQEFRSAIASLSLYAKLGRGETDYQAGQYGKVRELLAPTLKEMSDPAKAAQLMDLKEKNPQLVRGVLGLALRASVQDNQADQGKQILDILQKIFPESSLENLVQLVQQLQIHLQELRRQGPAARDQLKKTIAGFSTFLDELSKQHAKNPKPEITLFLGQSYSSLDQHKRAAELFNGVKEDAPPALYHLARVLYARELRLAKDFAGAGAVVHEILASEWGKHHLEAKKESILLLEDQEKYQLSRTQGAIPEWNQLMLSLRPKLQDNRIKEQYFDCYYHLTYCIFKSALKKSDKRGRQKDIHAAATFIARLEEQPDTAVEGCKKRFEQLMAKEPLLKAEYDAIKKK
jgi:hypothetical protein